MKNRNIIDAKTMQPLIACLIVSLGMAVCAPAQAQDDGAARPEDRDAAKRLIDALNNGAIEPDQLVARMLNQPAGDEVRAGEAGPVGLAQPHVGPTPRSLNVPQALAAPTLQLPALEAGEVIQENGSPLRNGRVAPLLATSQNAGRWIVLPEGGRLWTLTLRSPNAAGLRVQIDPFDPPYGAELIVYNPNDPAESYGPITSVRAREGLPYWTPRCFGNSVRLEYYLPPEVVGEHHLTITGVLLLFPPGAGDGGGWGPCQVDVTCEPAWATTALCVAHIEFVSGGGGFICSGSMINRLPAFDATPYFLTASHCISTQAEASTIEVYWLFQSAVCNGVPPALNTVPRTDGSELLENASDPDHTLLGLTMTDIPGGLVWAGWTSTAPANPQAATEIHHPLGAGKSISHGNFEGNDNGCGAPINLTYRFDLDNGGQAGGSSGSPVFTDTDHAIRAVVSCSATDLCSPGENCWEGRFATAFSTLDEYLNAVLNVWVNGAWAGTQSGTQAEPWNEVIEGHFGVPGGGVLHMQAGTYQQYSFIGGSKGFEVRAEGGSVIFE